MKAYVNTGEGYIIQDIASVMFVNGTLILVTEGGRTLEYSEESFSCLDEKNRSVTITA